MNILKGLDIAKTQNNCPITTWLWVHTMYWIYHSILHFFLMNVIPDFLNMHGTRSPILIVDFEMHQSNDTLYTAMWYTSKKWQIQGILKILHLYKIKWDTCNHWESCTISSGSKWKVQVYTIKMHLPENYIDKNRF